MEHFNRTPRRRAEFIRAPNVLKQKAGSGGLSEDILMKAQKLLEENTLDFSPIAGMYLDALAQGIEIAKGLSPGEDGESAIAHLIYPAMQLKANGGMFRYNLVTTLADKMVQFLEVLDEPDIEAVEIIMAFHTSFKAIVAGRITGDGGQNGQELHDALDEACRRYLDRHPPMLVDFV
jgi:hypothetical protein